MPQFGGHDFFSGIGGGFVGEMSVAAKDALLEAPRSARAILQHFYVVIGFEDERVGRAHAFEHELGRVAEISQEPDVRAVRAEQIANRVLRIVRNGKRFDEDIPNFKTCPGGKQTAVKFFAELKLNFLVGRAVAINRDAQLFAERGQTLNVVAVFVGDKDAGEIFRRATNGGEALADLAEAEARIHEDACLGGFHIGAIAAGTAAKDRQVNSHNGR